MAVLPFENLGAPEDDYFADGIADAVRGKLTSLPGIQVIARGSSTPYKKTTKTPQQIAQELEVDVPADGDRALAEGSGGASRVQVSPELVEVTGSGAPDLEVAAAVRRGADGRLPGAVGHRDERGAGSGCGARGGRGEAALREAHAEPRRLRRLPQGRRGLERHGDSDPSSLRQALGFYEQAVALDPGFAQAWARVSRGELGAVLQSARPTPELAERARQAAEKAVALAPDRPEGYLALGNYERWSSATSAARWSSIARVARCPRQRRSRCGDGVAEKGLGRWEAAVEHFRQAERLDPRSVDIAALGQALLRLRRYPEAREAFDRGLAFAPADLALIEYKAMTFLGEGDLAGARAVLKAAPKEVEPTALVAFLANYWDLVWVLDERQRELLLRLTPSAFDDNRGSWGICLAQAYALKGDAANVRTYAEEARKAFEEQLRAAPDDRGCVHVSLGLALAYLGRKEEAIREGERGVALMPVAKDAFTAPTLQHQLARIYMLVGEPEKALDQLEPLLKIPYYLSPGWLKIDPNFDPLRKNPRFQKLVAGK